MSSYGISVALALSMLISIVLSLSSLVLMIWVLVDILRRENVRSNNRLIWVWS
jgi:hypothetical protein